mmetsp:Transcript_12175/g.15922  ORF Transcript_12175/g.15922 Transcript_12175/m.15922 type:complete len:491 (+) Transcript_12175:199-1671(+)
MKTPAKTDLGRKARQELLKRLRTLSSSSDRQSPDLTSVDPVDFALQSIGRHAEAKASKMVISGKGKKLLPEIGQLDEHLRELEVSHTDIEDLSPLSGLPSLKSLKVNATKVSDWSVLSSLKCLRRLELRYSVPMRVDVPDLPELTELTILNTHGKITLGDLPKLKQAEFQVLEDLAQVTKQFELVELKFQKIGNQNLDALASLPNLQRLEGRLHGAVDLRQLASQDSLTSLRLTAPDIADVTPISALLGLETLRLDGVKVSGAHALAGLSELRSLSLRFAEPLSDLSFLSKMKELSRLTLCPAANCDLRPLMELPNLDYVDLVHISPNIDLSPLSGCDELCSLSVSTDEKVDGRLSGGVPAPPRLKTLSLYGRAISGLDGLEKCRDLQSIHCVRTSVDSLEPLKGIQQLTQIHVSGSNVSDLSVLATLPNFVAENTDIKLGIHDTPAAEQYPELAKTLGGTPLHQYEYGEHAAAVEAVRAVIRCLQSRQS